MLTLMHMHQGRNFFALYLCQKISLCITLNHEKCTQVTKNSTHKKLHTLSCTTVNVSLAPPLPARVRKWLPPLESFVKINSDGAVSRAGHGAVSAICRDEHGKYVGASSRVFAGFSDPASLEALVCSEALSLAEDLGERRLVVALDCAEIVASIQSGSAGAFGMIIKEIKARCSRFQNVYFKHEFRESNYELMI